MFAVTGATGQLGRLVIARLVQMVERERVIALVRNVEQAAEVLPAGVAIRQFDYDRPEGMAEALHGVRRLLLISSSEIGRRLPQHLAVVNAAKHAKVGLIAYTSLLHADRSPISLAAEHRETEAAIAASSLGYAILRNGWYLENYLYGAEAAIQHGAMLGSGGDGRISAANRADYAEAAAHILIDPPASGSILELAGDESFTEGEFAAALAQASGKPVQYVQMPEAEFAGVLAGAGLPEPMANMIANSSAAVAGGALFDTSGTLGRVIGRATVDWRAAVADVVAAVGAGPV